MQLILFTKMLREKNVSELAELGREWGLDGFDLCVRTGYPVSPENATLALPEAVKFFKSRGLSVPMVTALGSLTSPDDPSVRPLMSAMDKAGVGLLKLGYFLFEPKKLDYLKEVQRVRGLFRGWQALAEEFNVKVCCHTHSDRCMGLNASGLMHLLEGFDPKRMGAYLDAAHLAIEGECFDTAAAMARGWLSLMALKDAKLTRVEKNGHGSLRMEWVPAGEGIVDWTFVFETLAAEGYDGPATIHAEFEGVASSREAAIAREVAFFRRFVPRTKHST
jgi:sugar phosphate isomerase/epimerase